MTTTTTNERKSTENVPILFDMDGVVLRGRGTDPAVYADAADATLEELGAEPTAPQRRVLRSHRCDREVHATCDRLGIGSERFWATKERHASRIAHDRLRSGARTTYDDVAAIRELARDRPTALVSNNRQATVEFVVEYFDLDGFFELVRGRDATVEGFHRRKPNPYYLTETLEELGAEGGLYVGDRETDLLAAERAGIDGVFLRRSFNRGETPDPKPRREIESLYELTDGFDTPDAQRGDR